MTTGRRSLDVETSRRTFLALCAAVAGATVFPLSLRARALDAGAALSFAFSAHETAVLTAAANTVVPGEMVKTRHNSAPAAYPGAGDAGAATYIQNLLGGAMLFAAGARRPPYVQLPVGVTATYFPRAGFLPLTTVKAMGWFGDPVKRPTRPYTWPSELARLQALYRRGVLDLDAATANLSGGLSTDFSTAPSATQTAVLKLQQAQEAGQYFGQGEGNQPFFLTFLDHVAEACFGDPIYGGNSGYVYWEMTNFSGPSYIHTGGPSPGQGWSWKDLQGPFDRTVKPA